MTPLDPVNPTVPGNWVRRVDEKRRPKDPHGRKPEKGPQQTSEPKHPPGHDPDGRTHIIDDLA